MTFPTHPTHLRAQSGRLHDPHRLSVCVSASVRECVCVYACMCVRALCVRCVCTLRVHACVCARACARVRVRACQDRTQRCRPASAMMLGLVKLSVRSGVPDSRQLAWISP